MKTSSFIFLLLISFVSISQQTDFTVAAGAQRTLTAAERTLSLRNLTLGDDCVILIPASMDGWTVTATDATIGKNVKIIGMGLNGSVGANGSNGANGVTCTDGWPGVNGSIGMNGSAGKNVSLTLRIRKIESLTVTVNGGNGGNGGMGGKGGNGSNATCSCNAGKGGNAGNGGHGGAGGNGGKVDILYSAIGSASVSNSNFIIQNTGGRGGSGGYPGLIGKGGAGGGCSDPKGAARLAGAAGNPGVQGTLAIQGANGETTLQNTGK